jgi:hypothetical protein
VIVREPLTDYHFFSTNAIVAEPTICYSIYVTEKLQRVILYGDSLILSGVQASLENCPGIEIHVLDESLEKVMEELCLMCPSAVIFDLGATKPDSLFPILQQPGLLLIGIDPETHQALVWSGQHLRELSMPDLFQVLYIGNPKLNR